MISLAHAQSGFGGMDKLLEGVLPIALVFAVLYFFMIRPQSKKQKEHREMLGALKRGDRVVTTGGIVGKITKVIDENEAMLEIAQDVEIRILKYSVSQVLNKTSTVANDSESTTSKSDSKSDKIKKVRKKSVDKDAPKDS